MKIVITGGMGFVGSHLINNLKNKNEIFVIDNFSTNVSSNSNGFEIIEADLTDSVSLDNINLESIDILIHLAGPSSGPASAKRPKKTIQESNKITFNILNLCEKLKVKRFLFSSSMAVYGNPKKSPVNEDSVCEPISFYGIAKLCSEHIIKTFCINSSFDYSILRFFNIYGPGQDLNRMDQGIVSIYLSMLLKGSPFVIKGKLDRIRDLIHIDDIVGSTIKILNSDRAKNQTINICSGEKILISYLATTLVNHFDNYNKDSIIQDEGSLNDIHQIYGDNSKLVDDIGYNLKYDIKSGIENFVKWAKTTKID
tara:strand:+ start:595 stop:1527 length:933 start_codon:yes stop_codon:yes gene_type:complete